MRVTLEKGETLDVALVENDRIVGTLSLELRGAGLGVGLRRAGVETIARRSEPAAETASTSAAATRSSSAGRGGAKKKHLSAEARAKMAEAQRRRWERYRKDKSGRS